MDSLPSKDQLYGYFKASVAKAKQYAYNLSPTELLVEEATSNDAWGPTGTQMAGQRVEQASRDLPTTCVAPPLPA